MLKCSIQLWWQLLWRSPLQWQLWSLLLQRALSARIGLLHSKPVRMFQIQQPVLFFLAPCSKNSMQLLSTFDLLAWSAPEVPTTAGCISDRHRLSGTWLAPLEIDKMQLKGVSVAAILEQRGPKALCVRVRELRALKLRATE